MKSKHTVYRCNKNQRRDKNNAAKMMWSNSTLNIIENQSWHVLLLKTALEIHMKFQTMKGIVKIKGVHVIKIFYNAFYMYIPYKKVSIYPCKLSVVVKIINELSISFRIFFSHSVFNGVYTLYCFKICFVQRQNEVCVTNGSITYVERHH